MAAALESGDEVAMEVICTSVFHQRAEALERFVPAGGDDFDQPARLRQPSRLELEHVFSASATPLHQAGFAEHTQVLGDRLPCHARASREIGDREWPFFTKPRHQTEPRLVAERRE